MSQYGPPPGSPPDPYGGSPYGGSPYGQPYPPAPPGYGGGPTHKGFFGALFDINFTTFVTPMVVKVLYILFMVAFALGYIVAVIVGFTQSAGEGIAILIFGAIAVFIYLILIRVTLEFYLAVVRMSEDIHERLPTR